MNCTFHHLSRRVLSVCVASLIVLETTAIGQSSGLAIQILEGKAGQNLIAEELPPIKVRVLDRTGRAISGANVVFAAPDEGPTGRFLPNSNQITVATDTEGMAMAPRFRTNSTVGDYQIQIIASHGGSVSRAVIPQSNVLKKKSSSKKIFIFSALIGGAAAAALAGKARSGPAASALGGLAVTPSITLGGESSIGVSPTILGGTSGGTSASATFTGGTSSSGTTGEVAPPPTSTVCTGKSKSSKNSC